MKHHSLLLAMAIPAVALLLAACADASGTIAGLPDDAPQESVHGLNAADHGMQLVLPIPNGSVQQVTRGYGTASHIPRQAIILDDRYALDFAGSGCSSFGTPVVAVADGVVDLDRARFDTNSARNSYGDAHVVINHGNGCYSHYAHLDSRNVQHGERVVQGQVVGRQGNKGAVTGTACASHPGTHLHFKMFCGDEAIVPEPMSGYAGFRAGQTYGTEEHLRFPVGTLVRLPDQPEIYLVTGERSLVHVPDWPTFVGRRFFYSVADPDQRVAVVSERALACYAVASGMGPDASSRLAACSDGNYAIFTEGSSTLRRRIPFAIGDPRYRPLIASWGFQPHELRSEAPTAGCNPLLPTGAPLYMRPGTVVEEASDNDFWVITADSYRADDARGAAPRTHAMRVRRTLEDGKPFLPLLYGTYGVVLQVPDGSVRDFVTDGVRDGADGFTRALSRMCGYGPDAGGGGNELDILPDPPWTPPAPVPPPNEPAPPPEPDTPYCGVPEPPHAPEPAPPQPPPSPPPSTPPAPEPPTPPPMVPAPVPPPPPAPPSNDPPGTIHCSYRDASTLVVRMTGPVLDLLVGPGPTRPLAIQYGSNTDGWTVPTTGKPTATWNGTDHHELVLPRNVNGFNLYVHGNDGGAWFDLVDADRDGDRWTVSGVCRLDGTLLRH